MSNVLRLPIEHTPASPEGSELTILAEPTAPESEATTSPPPPNESSSKVQVTRQVNHPFIILLRIVILSIKGVFVAVLYSLKSSARYLINHPIHALLTAALVTMLGVVIVTGSEIHTQMILGKISDQTIDRVIEASRFNREFDANVINASGPKELLRVGAPDWIQREGIRAILFHARKAGLPLEDQAVLLAIADIESGFNPMARAPTSTACGLFQFVKRTGEIFGLPQDRCMDPWENARAGVAHYQYNMERRVAAQLGSASGVERVFRAYELSYYLHHDGPESNNPNNDVKATILNGTQFLFKAFHALQTENESQHRAPTFAETFSTNLLKLLDGVREWLRSPSLPSISSAMAMLGSEVQGSGTISQYPQPAELPEQMDQ